jgi:uncharacterized membrane protein YphA (DoxX/SURF4 family)
MSIWRQLLTAMFLFAGAMKLVRPIEAMAGPIGLPGGFLASSASPETVGAIGLILPGLTRIYPEWTLAAAAGLVVIMTGATVITAITGASPARSSRSSSVCSPHRWPWALAAADRRLT